MPTAQPPRLSVVMPVRNALPHLDAAIRSILDQSYRDFEFVILDDESTDGSTELLEKWAQQDSRIRLFRSETNLGPAGSSNLVVAHSRAPIVARMDADDVSHPDRLRLQIEMLDRHPEAGLVASLCDLIDPQGRTLRGPQYWKLARRSWFPPFPHGSFMYRRELFERVGGYRAECEFWEDQDLALRLAAESDVIVLTKALYKHRQSYSSTRVASDQARVEGAVHLMYECIAALESGSDYEERLKQGVDEAARVDPRVFIALGSLVLWSHGKPRLLKALLRRGKLGWNIGTATALVWTLWASAHPPSLRAFLTSAVRVRGIASAERLGGSEAVKWSPPGLGRDRDERPEIASG